MEKKKAGGQNKGIVEEEAPFGLDALMWKRNGKVAIEDGDDGYDWGFPAEAWLPAVRNLTRSPRQSDSEERTRKRSQRQHRRRWSPTQNHKNLTQAVAPYGWQLVSLGW